MKNTIQKEPLTRFQTIKIINKTKKERDKVLIILLYLLGSRISETLLLRRRSFDYTTSPDFVIVGIKTLKRKKGVLTRKIPIRKDEPLLPVVTGYIEKKELKGKLFDFTRQRAWQIIKEIDNRLWLHLFRHTRLSELANSYTDQQLTVFAGWSDSRPAKNYVYLRWNDLADKLPRFE